MLCSSTVNNNYYGIFPGLRNDRSMIVRFHVSGALRLDFVMLKLEVDFMWTVVSASLRGKYLAFDTWARAHTSTLIEMN